MVAISAVDIALWDLLGKSAKQPVFKLLGGRTKARIPVYASRLYATELNELASEASRYKDEGFKAMKLRFGWGPVDGAEGMQRNVDLVRTVREAVGDGIDVMADAYMSSPQLRRSAHAGVGQIGRRAPTTSDSPSEDKPILCRYRHSGNCGGTVVGESRALRA